MEEKKSLTKAETKNLFSRLELVYGAALRARWQDLPWTEVMGDWAARLGDFTGDSEAINYALEHLPDDFPPTVIAFKNLCEQGAMYRRQRERKELQREFDALVAPEGMEWCHVWEPYGALGRTVRKLMPIGSGWRRASPPDEVAQKARETMQQRGLKLELLA